MAILKFTCVTLGLYLLVNLIAKVNSQSSNVIEVPLNFDEYTTIRTTNFPNPYPRARTTQWKITKGNGYGVEFIIKDLDLDGIAKDYLYITPVSSVAEDSLAFTWKLKTERKYVLLHLDEMLIKFVANIRLTANNHKGFEILLKRIDARETTTPPPITEPPPLTYPPLETSYIYLNGMTFEEFAPLNDTFKHELAYIAEDYCEKKNITVENITIYDNINFHLIAICNIEWPNYETCVQIRYSIPVNSLNLTSGYELTAESLDDMWYSANIKWSNNTLINLERRPNMNNGDYLLIWLSIFVSITIAFFILLYLIWKYNCFGDYISSVLIHEDVEYRKSDASFFPIPNQIIPPLYGNDSYTDEKIWNDFPPEYTKYPEEIGGKTNHAYEKDAVLGYPDDDIIMSLEDSSEPTATNVRTSVDTIEADESNL